MTIRHIIMTLNHYMVVKSQQLLRTTSFRHYFCCQEDILASIQRMLKKRLSGVQVTISLIYFDHDFKSSVVQTTNCLVISNCFTSYMIKSCLSSVDLWQDSILGHIKDTFSSEYSILGVESCPKRCNSSSSQARFLHQSCF